MTDGEANAWAEGIAREVLGKLVDFVYVREDDVTINVAMKRHGDATVTFDHLSALAERFGSKLIDLTASGGESWSDVTPGTGAEFAICIKGVPRLS